METEKRSGWQPWMVVLLVVALAALPTLYVVVVLGVLAAMWYLIYGRAATPASQPPPMTPWLPYPAEPTPGPAALTPVERAC